jgi:hypothetical protein
MCHTRSPNAASLIRSRSFQTRSYEFTLRHEDFWKLEGHKEQSRRQPKERQRLCFRPPAHAPRHVWVAGSAAAERARARLVKRDGSAEAFLRQLNRVCFSPYPQEPDRPDPV